MLRTAKIEQRVARRANALLLFDEGGSCDKVAEALHLNDDTVRRWLEARDADGSEGLQHFDGDGGASYLPAEREARLKVWVGETLPRSTRAVWAHIGGESGIVHESRSGLIALLHRLRLEYEKPEKIGFEYDREKQRVFIAAYEDFLSPMDADVAALFEDAVHPTHAARPSECCDSITELLRVIDPKDFLVLA